MLKNGWPGRNCFVKNFREVVSFRLAHHAARSGKQETYVDVESNKSIVLPQKSILLVVVVCCIGLTSLHHAGSVSETSSGAGSNSSYNTALVSRTNAFGKKQATRQRSVFARLARQEDYFRPRRQRFQYEDFNPEDIRFEGYNRRGIPNWESDQKFKYDEFRFVRVKYDSYGRTQWGQKWRIDYPDSDLNFSFRLQQLTSLKVNPNPIFLELTDPRIFNYPFMYLIEPGDIFFTMEEAKAMRRYLNNGGFIMVDDFWGDMEWYDFEQAMQMVFPDRKYEELEIDHPIFHSVYDLKTKPQCPAIGRYEQTGETTDRPWDPSAREVHYRAYYDDDGRMCMIACFNTDLGDGWEREGESEFYFKRFSEKEAYPMGINIVVYAMTH